MNTANCFQSKSGPHVYVMVGALSLMAACSSGGESASVTPSTGAALSGDKYAVSVPTGSFEEAVDVTVTESKVDVAGIGSVAIVSTPLSLAFSKAKIVKSDDPIEVKLQLDPEKMRQSIADGKGIYAKVRVKGEQISYDRGDNADDTWIPVIGDLDTGSSTLTVKLFATASEIELVAVAGSGLKIITVDPASMSRSRGVKRNAKAINRVAMAQYPWAIVCDTTVLSDRGVGTCDASNPNSLVIRTQNALTEASKDLNNRLNMNVFVIQQLTALGIAQTNLSSFPDPAVLRRHDPSVKYNMAYLGTGCNGSMRSCYNGVTGVMSVAETLFNNGAEQAIGSTLHHELVHAVQTAVMISNIDVDASNRISRNSPIIEGTAQAVGFLASSGWNAAVSKGRVLNGHPRNWSDPLGKYTPYDDNYFMTEFFSLADNGSLNYLMPLFHAFNGAAGHFHRRLDVASQVALGKSLGEVYMTRVMPQRASTSPAGIYYTVHDVTNTDIQHRWQRSVSAMGTDPFLFTVTEDEDVCINIRLVDGVDPKLALVVHNGTSGGSAFSNGDDAVARYTTSGETLTVQGRSADVQVLNISPGGVADSKSYTIDVFTDGACLPNEPDNQPCNPMKVYCGSQGCGLYVQDFDRRCWARAVGCDAQGRCTRPGFEGGFDFGSCENLRNQMTQNIPVGDATREEAASLPEDRKCGEVDLGCRWMVLCGR